MGIKGDKSSSKLVSLLVLAVGVVLFFALGDLALPMYRWMTIDWEGMAQKAGVSSEQLQTKRDYVIRYHPRKGAGEDPYPWQIVQKDGNKMPAWVKDGAGKTPDNQYEYQTLIRCRLISDRTGTTPREPWEINYGMTFQDRYFKVAGWRLPPGATGEEDKRCLLMIDVMSVDKMTISEATGYHHDLPRHLKSGEWLSDDDWQERLDDFGN